MWQTFCIPLGLECRRYVFMCNDRNVLLCWQIGQLLQSLQLTMNDVSFTTQKNRTTPFSKTKRPWGWGWGIGRNWLVWLCLHRGQTSVAYFFSFSVISFNISWRNCPSFSSKWWAFLSLKILNLRPILLWSNKHAQWMMRLSSRLWDIETGWKEAENVNKREDKTWFWVFCVNYFFLKP